MSGNLYIGPGITIGSGITVTMLPYVPEPGWDFSGDMMVLTGTVDLTTETGADVDLNA